MLAGYLERWSARKFLIHVQNRKEDYSRLVDRIREVFKDVNYPGDNDILSTPEHVRECGECSGLQQALVDRKWEDLAVDPSGYVIHGMNFFTPRGWHYYLPAYLIQTINCDTFSSLHFEPSNIPQHKHLDERAVNLTRDQCRVIIAYLLIVLKKENQRSQSEVDRNVAAVNYWKALCERLKTEGEFE